MNLSEVMATLAQTAVAAGDIGDRAVCVLTEDGDVYEITKVDWYPENDCYFIHVVLVPEDDEDDEDDDE